jgi:cell wall-associated NlpC family hydrolase
MRKGLLLFVFSVVIAALTGCSSTSRVRVSAPPLIKDALERAQDLIGTPYCSAGVTPDCFDCSGFVGYCMQGIASGLPRTSAELFSSGESVSRDELQPGDLVFFATGRKGTVNHVGIYLTDGSFIHSSTSNGVMLSSLKEPYWNQRWKGARRVR